MGLYFYLALLATLGSKFLFYGSKSPAFYSLLNIRIVTVERSVIYSAIPVQSSLLFAVFGQCLCGKHSLLKTAASSTNIAVFNPAKPLK